MDALKNTERSMTSAVQDFIDKYSLVIHKSKSTDQHICIRSCIRNAEEAESFFKNFCQKTRTVWNVYNTSKGKERFIFHKTWLCHRAQMKKRIPSPKSLNCPARFDIKIKKMNKNTMRNDRFLSMKPPLPCLIRLKHDHSHSLDNDLAYMRVSNEIKDIFFGYFDNGFGVARALKLHEENLKNVVGENRPMGLFPKSMQVHYLYRLWREKKRISGVVCEDINDLATHFDVEKLLKSIPCLDPTKKRLCSQKLEQPLQVPVALSVPDLIPNCGDSKSDELDTNANSIPLDLMKIRNIFGNKLDANSSLQKIVIVDRKFSNKHIFPDDLKKILSSSVNSSPSSSMIPCSSNSSPGSTSTELSLKRKSPCIIELSKKHIVDSDDSKEPEVFNVSTANHEHEFFNSYCENLLENGTGTFIQSSDESSSDSSQSVSDSEESFSEPNQSFQHHVYGSNQNEALRHHVYNSDQNEVLGHHVYSSASQESESESSISNNNKTSFRLLGKSVLSRSSKSLSGLCKQEISSFDGTENSDESSSDNEMYRKATLHHSQNEQHAYPFKVALNIKKELASDSDESDELESVISTLPYVKNTSAVETADRTVFKAEMIVEDNVDSDSSFDYSAAPNLALSEPSEDEDQQFLMSLLPEIKRLPKDEKTRVKSQIQNLVLSARSTSYTKNKASSNLYRDCRTFPTLPAFK